MDSIVFWIFLSLISTLILNKIKLKLSISFFLFGVPQYVASPVTSFQDFTLIVLID
jgi:hypothetical protein